MLKLLFAVCLISASSMSTAAAPGTQCDTFSSTDEISTPLTIEEIEREAMAELVEWRKLRPGHPNAVFGYANRWWVSFKSMVQPGDEIIRYSTEPSSWARRSGHKGFALIRSGCIINRFVTVQS